MSHALKMTKADWKQESGPLKPYLLDESVSEIMVNSWKEIFIERNGMIEQVDTSLCRPRSQSPQPLRRCALARRLAYERRRSARRIRRPGIDHS
jgi:type IV secretory pathway ATPase VirB11/archaellum biosynthesis ATPase